MIKLEENIPKRSWRKWCRDFQSSISARVFIWSQRAKGVESIVCCCCCLTPSSSPSSRYLLVAALDVIVVFGRTTRFNERGEREKEVVLNYGFFFFFGGGNSLDSAMRCMHVIRTYATTRRCLRYGHIHLKMYVRESVQSNAMSRVLLLYGYVRRCDSRRRQWRRV